MTISRKTLAIFVVLGGWADILITLVGQIGYTSAREDDPVSRVILIASPLGFLALGFLFHALIGLLVYKAPAWIAIPVALMMLGCAVVAVVFWLAVLGLPIETMSAAIYPACIGAALLYAASRLCHSHKVNP
jgi:peptidoglycan/LPS O-acetylase OafA/YrhL